jgi:hypothetical protein
VPQASHSIQSRSRTRRVAAILLAFGLLFLPFGTSAQGETSKRPAPLKPLANGDLEVQINYVGGMAMYSTWLTLRRIAGDSSASYRIEATFMAIPEPKELTRTQPWSEIWRRLESEGFLDLLGDRGGDACENLVPLDDAFVHVEVQRGPSNRRFSYYAPFHVKCAGSAKFESTLTFLQEAFNRELPMPYEMTGCTRGGKCPDPGARNKR